MVVVSVVEGLAGVVVLLIEEMIGFQADPAVVGEVAATMATNGETLLSTFLN